MGVIQQAVNQLLGTTTVAAAGLKGLQNQQIKTAMAKGQSVAEARKATAESNLASTKGTSKESKMTSELARVKEENIASRNLMQAEAVKAETGGLIGGAKALKNIGQMVEEAERLSIEESLKRVASKQDTQKKQRRRFKDYLDKLETSLGGTVADLPSSLQKEIAKTYSSKERKEIMDKMDKEKGGKK